jgi:hypothetical protein
MQAPDGSTMQAPDGSTTYNPAEEMAKLSGAQFAALCNHIIVQGCDELIKYSQSYADLVSKDMDAVLDKLAKDTYQEDAFKDKFAERININGVTKLNMVIPSDTLKLDCIYKTEVKKENLEQFALLAQAAVDKKRNQIGINDVTEEDVEKMQIAVNLCNKAHGLCVSSYKQCRDVFMNQDIVRGFEEMNAPVVAAANARLIERIIETDDLTTRFKFIGAYIKYNGLNPKDFPYVARQSIYVALKSGGKVEFDTKMNKIRTESNINKTNTASAKRYYDIIPQKNKTVKVVSLVKDENSAELVVKGKPFYLSSESGRVITNSTKSSKVVKDYKPGTFERKIVILQMEQKKKESEAKIATLKTKKADLKKERSAIDFKITHLVENVITYIKKSSEISKTRENRRNEKVRCKQLETKLKKFDSSHIVPTAGSSAPAPSENTNVAGGLKTGR